MLWPIARFSDLNKSSNNRTPIVIENGINQKLTK